ncbi:hypothetical protein [Agriterribacter sp.]|uniref:hypothetical protein n=1 Tax=Agriterribacter sp. TaxID=2821509 RepID=UPI002CC42D72|nr:hypothetical protein [Agriterribacter sp.]HRO45451.1 hypothetical protein [Agriterribacter sp.]HRQ19168.1 hypothetical protein [Agriterribacter sp.]
MRAEIVRLQKINSNNTAKIRFIYDLIIFRAGRCPVITDPALFNDKISTRYQPIGQAEQKAKIVEEDYIEV